MKLYDDGASTYFKFRDPSVTPSIAAVGADGKESPVAARRAGDLWVVDIVAKKFSVRQGNAAVSVYNEKLSHS